MMGKSGESALEEAMAGRDQTGQDDITGYPSREVELEVLWDRKRARGCRKWKWRLGTEDIYLLESDFRVVPRWEPLAMSLRASRTSPRVPSTEQSLRRAEVGWPLTTTRARVLSRMYWTW